MQAVLQDEINTPCTQLSFSAMKVLAVKKRWGHETHPLVTASAHCVAVVIISHNNPVKSGDFTPPLP